MYCKHCGKDVGNAAWCPYCGAKQTEEQQDSGAQSYNFENQNAWGEQINLNTPVPRTNIFAIVGLILAFFSNLLGLIFSIIGLTKAREYGSGRGLAIAGIVLNVVLGILSIIISIVVTLYWLPQVEQILLDLGYTLS